MGSLGSTKDFDVFNGFYNTINGKLTTTETTRHGTNPATGKALAEVPVSTQKDVDDAVVAAKAAFKTWSKVPLAERQKAVRAYADGLEKYVQEFGKLLTSEQGKPVRCAWRPGPHHQMPTIFDTNPPPRTNLPLERSKLVYTGYVPWPTSSLRKRLFKRMMTSKSLSDTPPSV